MARTCTVCTHPDRPAIDQALVNRRPFRALAEQFHLSTSALVRHSDDHVPAEMAKARDAERVADADGLLAQLGALRSKAMALLLKAEASGDLRTALFGVREARATIELLLEVEQRISRQPTLTLVMAPEWLATRSALLEALRPYPEARTAVAAALVALEATA